MTHRVKFDNSLYRENALPVPLYQARYELLIVSILSPAREGVDGAYLGGDYTAFHRSKYLFSLLCMGPVF